MDFISVFVAAIATFAFGAAWYGGLSKPWIRASGVPVDADGKPRNGGSPAPYAISFLCILVVAIMMNHTFDQSGMDSFGEGLVGGFGIGAFFITPWLALNHQYTMKPPMLTAIDGGYATLGCTIMGVVLILF